MDRSSDKKTIENLPKSALEFIKLVIKKMRYRRSIRRDVQAELTAHFEDELRDCSDEQQRQQKAQRLIEQFGDAKLLGILLRRAKKRCRPLWRTVAARTFQTIGALIVVLVLYCVYISMGQPTVKVDYLKEMTELVRPKTDESLNAANLYNQAIALYKEQPKIEIEREPYVGPPGFDLPVSAVPNDVNIKPPPTTQELLSAIKGKSCDELTEVELAKLKEWIQDNSEAIDLYVKGSKRPHCWWHRKLDKDKETLMSLMLPELGSMRDLSKLVGWQSKLKADQGDIEDAFRDVFAVYRVGEHYKGPRKLVEQLVGIAIQALAVHSSFQIIDTTEMDEQTLEHIQDEFQLLVDRAIFKVDFTTERFFLMDFIQRCYTDNGRGSGRMIPAGLRKYFGQDEYLMDGFYGYFPALGASLISTSREKMTQKAKGMYDSFDELSKFTPWQRHQKSSDPEFDLGQWSRMKRIRYWPVAMLMPASESVCRLSYQIKAESQALITVVALQRYQRRNSSYPETLDVLVQKGLLKELPVDPFSSTTLIYRKTEDNFVLYSYGRNLEDDGGKVYRDVNGRVKLWDWDEDNGGDAVFWPVQK